MRKIALTILAGVIALTIAGCMANTPTATESGASEPTATSGAVSEPAQSTEPAEKEESAAADTGGSNDNTEMVNATDTPAATQTPENPAATQQAAKPADPPKQAVSQPSASSAPPQTEAPKPSDPPATSAPEPTEPPKPKTAYDAPYDTAQMIADARAYGESIGMTWSDPLTVDNCSWEAPGTTSSVLSGDRLKTAIEGRIARIKKLQQDNGYQPGEFHFKVVFTPQGNGEYTIYFLMG